MRKLALWFQMVLLAGCSAGGPAAERPDLPKSVAPGWAQQSYSDTAPPAGLPPSPTAPKCWLAAYSGPGTAEVRVCAFAAGSSSFDAGQRYPTVADTVKFQIENWFVLVHWTGASQTDVTALVRAVQRVLQKK